MYSMMLNTKNIYRVLFVLCLIVVCNNSILHAQPHHTKNQGKSVALNTTTKNIMLNPVLGTLRLLIVRPKYKGDHSGLVTDTEALQHANTIKNTLETNSYGKLTVQFVITPVLNMPKSGSYYLNSPVPLNQIRADAYEVAFDAGYDFADYDREIFLSKQYWNGAPGQYASSYATFESLGNPYHNTHELGHTFDWHHASFWQVQTSPISPNGTSIEYGDIYDIMGDVLNFHHYNPWYKHRAGWLPDENVLTVTSSGTFTIQALENTPDQNVPVQNYSALRIRRSSSVDYWVFYRRDESLVNNGAIITQGYYSNFMPSRLLDMTPGSQSADWKDAALAVGQKFEDTAAGITIKTQGKTSNTLTIAVTVTQSPPGNLPVIGILSSASDTVLSGVVNYEIFACDPDIGTSNGDGIQQVELFLHLLYDGLIGRLRRGLNPPQPSASAVLTSPPYKLDVNTKLIPDAEYYMVVRATGTDGNFNMVWLDQPVDNTGPTLLPPWTPVQALPVNGSTDEPINPTLKWHPARRASTYGFQVALDQTFINPVIDQAGETDTSHTLINLSYNTTYYWRMNASNAAGSSSISAVWQFTTKTAPPAAPVLISPVDDAIDVSVDASFRWIRVEDGSSFQLQVTKISDFSTLITDQANIADTSFQVFNLEHKTEYFWRVRATNDGGSSNWSAVRSFTTAQVSSVGRNGEQIPEAFSLSQNYPNPFNPSTNISFALPQSSRVTLKVYGLLGEEIVTLVDKQLASGKYTVTFNANKLASGIYFYRIQAGFFTASKKFILVR